MLVLPYVYWCFISFLAGDEEHSGPSWAVEEDDDDPENRYGSKSPSVEFIKQSRCGTKAGSSNLELCAKPRNTHVIKTQLRPIRKRPKRSCSRAPAIKYTF